MLEQPDIAEDRLNLPPDAAKIDADTCDAYTFNRRLQELASDHETIAVYNPRARHNLAVGLTLPVRVVFLGSVGYYCGGFNAGASLEVHGNAGWAIGEAMSSGRIIVHGSTAWAAGASMRGGTIVIEGDAGPRTGVAMKGGEVLVGGRLGFMSGFMAHAGMIVALHGAGNALAASMYEGQVFVAGDVDSLGADAKQVAPTEREAAEVRAKLVANGLPEPPSPLTKIVAEGRLWYFDVRDAELWRQV